jgi:phage-related holin
MSESPSTYLFVHWFVGLPVVLCVSRVIDVLRKIVKEDYLKVLNTFIASVHYTSVVYTHAHTTVLACCAHQMRMCQAVRHSSSVHLSVHTLVERHIFAHELMLCNMHVCLFISSGY